MASQISINSDGIGIVYIGLPEIMEAVKYVIRNLFPDINVDVKFEDCYIIKISRGEKKDA